MRGSGAALAEGLLEALEEGAGDEALRRRPAHHPVRVVAATPTPRPSPLSERGKSERERRGERERERRENHGGRDRQDAAAPSLSSEVYTSDSDRMRRPASPPGAPRPDASLACRDIPIRVRHPNPSQTYPSQTSQSESELSESVIPHTAAVGQCPNLVSASAGRILRRMVCPHPSLIHNSHPSRVTC